MLTDIDRRIVSIILSRRTVAPRWEPISIVEEIITASDQLHTVVTRSIPSLIMPFRMIRAEYLVMLTLPAITSFNPMVLVESNRLNLLRLWLCAEARVLRFDLLHLLRIGLLPLGPRFSLRVLLAGCRN